MIKPKWLFHSGDDRHWALPTLSDSGWRKVSTRFGEGQELSGWQGISWFRLWVQVDTALTQNALGLRINHDGASEIYVDGKYRGGFGKVGRSKAETQIMRAPFEVVSIELGDTKPHLIAIRYANFGHIFPNFIGFQTWIGDYKRLHDFKQREQSLFEYMWLCTAAQLALALLHLFLFLFYPKQKLNLYYVIFSVLFAGSGMAVSGDEITNNPMIQWWWEHIFWICGVLGTISAWHLLYAVGHTPTPRWKVIFAAFFLLVYFIKKVIFMDSAPYNDGFNWLFLLILMDGLWALTGAIRRGQPHIWLVGVGMILIILLYFFVGADVFFLWSSRAERCLAMNIGLLSFPVLFSIYLALDFARTNQDLTLRLAEVENLSIKALAQEAEKLELITHQAEKLEKTVIDRTAQVQRQADQLQELDQIKSRFFINLTHEFRTPLTLILGPAKQILAKSKNPEILAHTGTIERNADKLLQLINQLLDLSKLEAGKMELKNTSAELVSMIRRNILLFQSLAEQKDIKLTFTSGLETLWLSIDQTKLESILYNLLSNAIKFTEPGGYIAVELNIKGDHFDLLITDTGIGIPEHQIPYIFDRFYQVDASDTRTQEGSGIGLAITKELTELMGGELFINSIAGQGTEIQVHLPIKEASATNKVLPSSQTAVTISRSETMANTVKDSDLPLVLVIEDNDELRHFIGSVIAANYNVIDAPNGEEGLALGLARIPDLVITDLMMPVMNGYEVCAGLKANEKTSHIPVVILTAKADTDSRIAGLETKADAYLSKPFDQRELLASIANLISLRRKLQEKYNKGNIWLTEQNAMPSMEQIFLDKIRQAVEQNLDDELYSVDQLGDDIGLSRTQLHRKLKGLTGQGPGELIRVVRLQKAYQLLKNKTGTIAEVAYMVGFGNPNSFSTSFSKYFGFAPSEAINN
ncbi:ATP-binding protein [Mucilaginibacter terrae]|uniref:ATP-binding protein n=1 Tax=Mucilaginibacter terrae TaxID=1955052 RepID=UPI0036392FF8